MKKIKYSGVYKVKPGDFLVYTNNGKSVVTERELRDKKLAKKNWRKKLMFEISSNFENSYFFIRDSVTIDANCEYLHCDGRIINVCEYFESREAAQRVLDKFYPKPEYVWKHGDVFENSIGMWIYLEREAGAITVNLGHTNSNGTPKFQLENAKFLFNIKEKI